MSLMFLIPLAIALGAVYLFEHSTQETAVFATAVGIVGAFLSLVLAPWQIQLLLLAVILLKFRGKPLWVYETFDSKETKLPANEEGKQAMPNNPSSKDEIIGKYRGADCKIQPSENTPVHQPNFTIKYRGASTTRS